jgi:hypothetical protein
MALIRRGGAAISASRTRVSDGDTVVDGSWHAEACNQRYMFDDGGTSLRKRRYVTMLP